MKEHSIWLASSIAALLVWTVSWSIPMPSVGGLDVLRGSASLGNSSETAEAKWASSVLGFTVTFDSKINCGGCGWQAVDGINGWAMNFGSDPPAFYLVKTGGGSSIDADGIGGSDTHFLFENLGELQYGVVSLAQLGFGASLDITKISHVTVFAGGGTSVPEPTTLGLLGLGLLGVGLSRRLRAR